jgi:hypothetical protein
MQVFKRAWDDIRKGDNIDLYIAVPLAVVLAVLNLFGLTPTNLISPVTLVILGLLATALLGTRHAVKELSNKLTQTADTFFLDEYPSTLKTDFESATELWMVGISLTTPIRTYYSTLESKLRKGHLVRVLLVDPDNTAVEMSELRAYVWTNVDRGRSEIRNSLQDLCNLKKIATDKLQIRTIRYPVGFGMFGMNPDTISGILYLKYYPFRTTGGAKPKIVLRARDGQWYELFRSELHNLWDNGTEWVCEERRPSA